MPKTTIIVFKNDYVYMVVYDGLDDLSQFWGGGNLLINVLSGL